MAFSRPPVTAADGTFSAAGAAAWAAGFGVAGATVGGIPYFIGATGPETTSSGLTFDGTTLAATRVNAGSGDATTPGLAFSAETGMGFARFDLHYMDFVSDGARRFSFGPTGLSIESSLPFSWGTLGVSVDAGVSRGGSALLLVGNGTAGSFAGSLKAAVYQGMMGTGAGIGNMVSTATVNTTAVATTGAGPDILQTYDLPLNSFSASGKGVHITVWGTSANTAEAKTIILYFGTTAILTNALTASIAGVWRIEADVFSTGTDAQQYVAQLVTTGTAGVALNDVEQGTSAQDDGAAITIKCTGTIGAPSSAAGLVQEGLTVRFIN